MEVRQSYDCLISIMGFPLLVRWHLYTESGPRGCLNIKMLSYQYRDPNVKDKMVSRHGNPHTWERRSLYWVRTQIARWMISVVGWDFLPHCGTLKTNKHIYFSTPGLLQMTSFLDGYQPWNTPRAVVMWNWTNDYKPPAIHFHVKTKSSETGINICKTHLS